MKLGKLVQIKPLEKPLLILNCQSIVNLIIAIMILAAFALSPFILELGSAFIDHSTFLKQLTHYVEETRQIR